MENSGFTVIRSPSPSISSNRVVLGGVMLDVEPLAGQLGQQLPDRLALVDLDVPRPARGAVAGSRSRPRLASLDQPRVRFLVAE
jgi:hypothetical protein